MTTIGKILTFLVFVAALGMGGLMVFVSRTTPQWAEAAKERDDKINVYKAMLEQEHDSRQKLVRENEKMRQLLDNQTVDTQGVKGQLKVELEDLRRQRETAEEMQKKANQGLAEAVAEKARMQREVELAKEMVKKREESIIDLQAKITQALTAEQQAKNDTETAKARLLSMMDRLKEMDQKFAEVQNQKSQPTGIGAGPKDATYSNPPPVYVKGRIDRVDDADKSLVKITIGSDSGIRKDQTLEVYRLSPRAEYLGRLVIVDADLHHAVARLLRQPGTQAPALHPGDEVASKLRP